MIETASYLARTRWRGCFRHASKLVVQVSLVNSHNMAQTDRFIDQGIRAWRASYVDVTLNKESACL